ncbi:MAG: hypothetical protein OES32_14935 [Acidobacteriota bacterium]|nr:hypothetical protein [Acidobacteriota bacterium]MDH3524875.1 hypothetical protein [Acidobacteriota bacterium]
MRSRLVFQILFILYCVEAGIFLAFVPWSPLWERHLLAFPLLRLRAFGLHPLLRSAISGFGLVHLIWGVHDLELLLARWRAARPAAGGGGASPPPGGEPR